MKIELFHAAFEPTPVLVATRELQVDVMAVPEHCRLLDEMFRATQNVHTSWVHASGQFGLNVIPTQVALDAGGCRSTSVGDYALVYVGEGFIRYDCVRVGWKPVPCDELAMSDG